MPNSLPSRELHVFLSISGHQNGDGSISHLGSDPNSLQYSYSLNYAVPSATSDAVASNGDLDLGAVGSSSSYSNQVDIYFDVVGSITGNDGNSYPVRFATATEGNPPDDVGFCWRVNNETDENPIPWPNNIVVTRNSNTQVLIDDQSPGNSTVPYYYCLGTSIDNINGAGNYYYITFDPKIVRG
jgi:hypothetical protein